MKEIPLTQGKVALISDEDFALVSKYKWHAIRNKDLFYASSCLGKHHGTARMHRLIMGTPDKRIHIDHKDGNGLNNTRENLRFADPRQNLANTSKTRASKSGRKGVELQGKKWLARIRRGKKLIRIGRFDSIEEASRAYEAAARIEFGEFFRQAVPYSKEKP